LPEKCHWITTGRCVDGARRHNDVVIVARRLHVGE
jgi:hypothetical protein